jgi:hypothetical protein
VPPPIPLQAARRLATTTHKDKDKLKGSKGRLRLGVDSAAGNFRVAAEGSPAAAGPEGARAALQRVVARQRRVARQRAPEVRFQGRRVRGRRVRGRRLQARRGAHDEAASSK